MESPKSHEYVSGSPSGSLAVAVNAIDWPVVTPPVGVRPAVTVGARLGCVTVMLSVSSSLPPLPSETVTLAEYVPAVVYACVGFCVVEVGVPSPKSHVYVSVSLSGSVPAAVNETFWPVSTLPVGVRPAVTVGGWLAASAWTITVPCMDWWTWQKNV